MRRTGTPTRRSVSIKVRSNPPPLPIACADAFLRLSYSAVPLPASVLDDHLSGKLDGESKEYLVGGKFSLADMCAQPWYLPSFILSSPCALTLHLDRTRAAFWGGLKIGDYPSVLAWHDRINALPVVQTALKVPVQDLVTRVKSTPGLEQEIMERMRKQKEENARKRAEEEKKETSG